MDQSQTHHKEMPISEPPVCPIPEPATVIIEPTRGWSALQLGALWEYRELLYFLVWRDLKVRYKQTLLGVAIVLVRNVSGVLG